jgi:hypothetical protein
MLWLRDKRLWIYDMSQESFHIVRESVMQWGNANANYNDDAKTSKPFEEVSILNSFPPIQCQHEVLSQSGFLRDQVRW